MGRGQRDSSHIVGQMSIADFSNALDRYVVQSGTLIMAKQSLKLNSAKLIRAAIKQIDPYDTEFKPYIITIPEMAELFGIQKNNLYTDIHNITNDILQNPVYIKNVDPKNGKIDWTKIPWVKRCDYYSDIGLLIKLNDELKPLLLNLQEKYKYTYEKIASMTSQYSIRIYEIINVSIGEQPLEREGVHVMVPVDELKEACSCENKYKEFSNFRIRVLDIAVKEINEYSNLDVSYTYMKEGKKVKFIDFLVKPKQ